MRKISTDPLMLLVFFIMIFCPVFTAQAAKTVSLIEPAQLKEWIDAGYHTNSGERVIIIDVEQSEQGRKGWFAGDVTTLRKQLSKKYGAAAVNLLKGLDQKGLLGHIPGAITSISHANLETMERSDGPIDTEHEVGAGESVEELVQHLGIKVDDVIVITSSMQMPWMVCPPRLWWTLYYWGFSPEKIKLLDGGNKAYALAGYPLERGVHQPLITPSKFMLDQIPNRHFEVRINIGELLDMVDSGKTSNGEVQLLDARQPPASFYLKDELDSRGGRHSDGVPDVYQIKGFSYSSQDKTFTRTNDQRQFNLSQMLFNREANNGKTARVSFNRGHKPSISPNRFIAMQMAKKSTGGKPFFIPIGKRSADFDGIIKGARLVKTASYNLTIPALVSKKDNRFKSRKQLRAIFAKAGISGNKPIVLYCNSGALASFYFYALHEVCGYKNVRVYDGSWQEWATLTASEPAGLRYVRYDIETVYPAWPTMTPTLVIFSGRNSYLEWGGKRFINSETASPAASTEVTAGGSLDENARWDTLHRSEHIVFRPMTGISDPGRYQTYNPQKNWPDVDTVPDYKGRGNEVRRKDSSYRSPKEAVK